MQVLREAAELAPFAEDYGRLGLHPPKVVVKPRDAADVQRALSIARDEGLTVRARSGGHGLEGQVRPDRVTLNAWPRAKEGALMLALGVFYYLGRERARETVLVLRATRDHAIAHLDAQPYFTDGLPVDWGPVLGPERLAAVRRVLARADPHAIFARLRGL